VRYEDLIRRPQATVAALCESLELEYSGGLRKFAEAMPAVNTLGRPATDKWKRNEAEISSVLDEVREISSKLGYDI
jgi:hypothetical protein